MVTVLIVAGLIVVAFVVMLAVLAGMFQKVGPNEALIVSGFGGT